MTDDLRTDAPDYSQLRVRGYIVTPVVADRFHAQLMDTIPNRFDILQLIRMEDEPPAAGMSEIAAVIELVNNSRELILAGIILWQTKARRDRWRRFREFLVNSRKSKASGRVYIPLCISVGDFEGSGSVRFYFHGAPDPATLDSQWEKMRIVIAELPDEAFMRSPGPQEYGFFWDYERSEWVGELFNPQQITTRSSDSWIPQNIFGVEQQGNESR